MDEIKLNAIWVNPLAYFSQIVYIPLFPKSTVGFFDIFLRYHNFFSQFHTNFSLISLMDYFIIYYFFKKMTSFCIAVVSLQPN